MDISKIWPGWTITERLGHGGFGHVYKATCAETDAVAAVKVITIPDNPDIIEDLRYSGRNDDEILAMCHEEAEHMMEEIKVMQKLKGSANIVSIEDSALRKKEDSIGYDIYIRMEYLTPLKNRIAELSPLSDEAVVKIGCDICSALEICHKKTASKRQIIHRDIKPDNILYHELSDAYKLGDFGIARERFDTTNTLTRGIGTARFIAPEVEAGSVYDHRADLYSLGLLLYFLRNRERLPFEYLGHVVDDTSVSRAKWKRVHGNEPIPPPIDASPALTEVILKACAYEPKDRYVSAGDMKEALLKALKQPYKTTSQTQTTFDKTVPSSSGAAVQTISNVKPKKKKTVRWILGLVVAGVLIYYGLPWLFWDEVMGDDTITYEDTSGTEEDFSRINDIFHNSAVFREKISHSKVIMLQEEYDVFNDINHTLEPDFNSMYLYYLGMIDPTLPSPDTELEEFTVTPNEAVLQEPEADHEPLDNSFEIICVRTSNHVEPDEECE